MKLPPELRLLLWRTTWKDRVVVLQAGPRGARCSTCVHTDCKFDPAEETNSLIIHTHTKVPMTFRINRESRYETLSKYKLFELPDHESRIYFRPGTDVPSLPWLTMPYFVGSPDLAESEELMITGGDWCRNEPRGVVKMPQDLEQPFLDPDDDLRAFPRLRPRDISALCPKVEWVYVESKIRYKFNPWYSRRWKKQLMNPTPVRTPSPRPEPVPVDNDPYAAYW